MKIYQFLGIKKLLFNLTLYALLKMNFKKSMIFFRYFKAQISAELVPS
jgi:hypothetical protein